MIKHNYTPSQLRAIELTARAVRHQNDDMEIYQIVSELITLKGDLTDKFREGIDFEGVLGLIERTPTKNK